MEQTLYSLRILYCFKFHIFGDSEFNTAVYIVGLVAIMLYYCTYSAVFLSYL